MKIFSKTIGREIDFETFEKVENGKAIRVILHDSLENIIHNDVECKYDYEVVVADTRHSVVVCTMTDGKRTVKGIGESIPATLENEIAKNYPTLIATQRAFDRAAIRFLGLASKVFSNTEISLIDFTLLNEENLVDLGEVNAPAVNEDVTKNSGIITSVIHTDEDNVDDGFSVDVPDETVVVEEDLSEKIDGSALHVNEVAEEVVEEELDEEIPVEIDTSDICITNEDDPDFCGNYIVTLKGIYAGKNMTLSEIAKVNRNWITFIAGPQFNATTPIAQEHKIKCQEFLEYSK